MAVNKDKFVLARFQYVIYAVQPAIVVYLYILLHIAYNHCHGKEVVSQVVQLLFFIAFVYIVDIIMHCECVLIPDNSKKSCGPRIHCKGTDFCFKKLF